MDLKLLLTVFSAVFVAELGDKTQLSTLLFASRPGASKWTIFLAASLALTATSALGVLAGTALSAVVTPRQLNVVAGLDFIAIGLFTLLKA